MVEILGRRMVGFTIWEVGEIRCKRWTELLKHGEQGAASMGK